MLTQHGELLGDPCAPRVGRLDRERDRAALGEPVHGGPHVAAEVSLQGGDEAGAAALREPGDDRLRHGPLGARTVREVEPYLRRAPHSRRQRRAEREAERRAVVRRQPAGELEVAGIEQRLGVGQRQHVAQAHGGRLDTNGRDDADQFPLAHRHHGAHPDGNGVPERLGDAVGVVDGERERERDADARVGHRRVTPSPGAVGSVSWPPWIVAPSKGSLASSAAPSRSTMSTSGAEVRRRRDRDAGSRSCTRPSPSGDAPGPPRSCGALRADCRTWRA